MGPTFFALTQFCMWFLVLIVGQAISRGIISAKGGKQINAFSPDDSDLVGFVHRLTRARNNCYETLPIFIALAFIASATDRLAITDPLAMYVLYARLAQSAVHLISTSVPAVVIRSSFFLVQIGIYIYWGLQLMR